MESVSGNPLAKMTDVELSLLLEHLTDYALRKMRRLTFRGVRFSGGGGMRGESAGTRGIGPADLAEQAIELFLDGTRTWNRETQPDFRRFLKGIIDSRVNHLVESVDNRTTQEAPVAAAARKGAPTLESQARARGSDAIAPDELCADAEWRERVHKALFREIEGEPLLTELVKCFGAGFSPAEAAEFIGVEVSEIYNARRRLARTMDRVTAKLARSNKP